MLRNFAPWALIGAIASSCGPDARDCSGASPNFIVVLKLVNRPLPRDTIVHVSYGGSGKEDYRVSETHAVHEVVFCEPADAQGQPLGNASNEVEAGVAGAVGEAGEAGSLGMAGNPASGSEEALYCRLWTGGFTELEVSASGLAAMVYSLTPRARQCTVSQTIVLDSPDGG